MTCTYTINIVNTINMMPSDTAVSVMPQVKLITAADCQLAVSIYPKFAYNASSGGGTGTVQQLGDNKLQITFDTHGVCQQ
jgi:hypothetical protein